MSQKSHWERCFRSRLAVICMTALSGQSKGDLAALTDELIEWLKLNPAPAARREEELI
jgi:hypothetical protein